MKKYKRSHWAGTTLDDEEQRRLWALTKHYNMTASSLLRMIIDILYERVIERGEFL